MFSGDDEEMVQASLRAQETFRYLWREVDWERRRIVPALDLACVKAPFSDGELDGESRVEHMWVSDLDFDGALIHGTLINSPDWLKSVSEGDPIRLPLEHLGDWMYASRGRVYGAYTVNLMRSRMSPEERAGHDEAWGLEFGDPAQIQVAPEGYPETDHPMSVNMRESLEQDLAQDAQAFFEPDEEGWTLLHRLALSGSLSCVEALLAHGADRKAKTKSGLTPLDLAKCLQWTEVAALLR